MNKYCVFLFLLVFGSLNAAVLSTEIPYDGNVGAFDNCCQIPSYPEESEGWHKCVESGDDGSSEKIDLGFEFYLYGDAYKDFYININGNVTFEQPFATWHTADISTNNFPMIAPYWSDIDTRESYDIDKDGNRISTGETGGVYYRKTEGQIQVLWYEVGYFNSHSKRRATFMLTLTSQDKMMNGANVAFCYSKLQFTTGEHGNSCMGNSCKTTGYPTENDNCSDGSGFGGTPATVGITLGNKKDFFQIGRFDRLKSTEKFKGSYDDGGECVDYDAVDWLLGNCDLKYNVSGEVWSKVLDCENGYYGFELSFFSSLFGKNVKLFYDDYGFDDFLVSSEKRVYNVGNYKFVADGKKHELKIVYNDNGEIQTRVVSMIAPSCCPSDDWDININGEDLAASYCSNKLLEFSTKAKNGTELTHPKYTWSFSNSESSDLSTPEKTYTVASEQTVTVKITSDECKEGITLERDFVIDVCPVDSVCPTEFAPTAGKKYILSGWMHVEGAKNVTSYADYGSIEVKYEGSDQVDECTPSGDIIDEWQRIYKEIRIPDKATQLFFVLKSKENGKDCYFDDIRFLPIDASMVSYVYDPVTLRLVAELDNENYATFYEYDEEGALIRVKKETERGIMTIKEARQGGVKLK